jgi:formylglycine-generating enzyme required for sulfatase activity
MSSGAAMKMDEPAVKVMPAMDIYEVTNAQFRKFIEANGYTSESYWSAAGWQWVQDQERRQPSYWEDKSVNQPEQPVVGVTWYEADAYCRWTGKELPTDAQWEETCRGPERRLYPWGDKPLETDGGTTGSTSDEIQNAVVGSTPQAQTPDGIYDLAGSVLEWTATEKSGQEYILRGGSGPATSTYVGCNVSHVLLPSITANFIGFRCHQFGADSQAASQ